MSIFDRIREALDPAKAPISDEPVVYRPIGVVQNRIKASKPSGWEDVKSDILLREELAEALEGIEDFSHIIVVFHMDQVPEEERRLRLPIGTDAAERGVYATRSQRRPNPIGVAVVALTERKENILRVVGLDAVDGTPVLDVKPYLPGYDAVADAKLAHWAAV